MGNSDLIARQAEALKGVSPESARALGISHREVLRHNLAQCEKDIRKCALEIIEEVLPFAQRPEIQEWSTANAQVIIDLGKELQEAIAELKSVNDELDVMR